MAKGIKTGGRSLNTPNKITRVMKDSITKVLKDEIKQLPDLLNKISDYERVCVIVKLAALVLPKPLNETETTTDNEPINNVKVIVIRSGPPLASNEKDIVL